MPNLADALDRTEFVALNICRVTLPGGGTGYQASLQRERGGGFSVRVEPTCSAAVAAVLSLPSCPVALPACPVGLPV